MLFSRWFGEESNLDLRDFTPALVRISYQTRPTVKGRSRGPPSGEGGDRTRGLRLARVALSQRELHPQRVAFCPRGGTEPERSPANTCLLVHASRVRFELTSNRIKSPAPYRSSHRPNKSRRRDSNPQPSGYEPDELPIAPLRSSGGRTRTCDMRRNRTPFYSLNYTGMSPDQDSPDRGLPISCTIRFSRVKRSNSPKTAKRVPLGRAKGSIPKLDHL